MYPLDIINQIDVTDKSYFNEPLSSMHEADMVVSFVGLPPHPDHAFLVPISHDLAIMVYYVWLLLY